MNHRILRMMVLLMIGFIAIPSTQAQEKDKKEEPTISLYGKVFDQFTGQKLQARVALLSTDSTFIDGRVASRDKGDFRFRLPARKASYILKFALKGYHTQYVNYSIKYVARNQYFEIPNVKLKRKMEEFSHDLDEVEVKATRVKMCYHCDTIVYDARAFNVPEGSMLDGLIRQLPGAELKSDGTIFINGKKVDYLTLNGEDFFRGNNKVILENLPYYTVKDIQVYNKLSDEDRKTGIMTQRPDYVMDINLKPEYHDGFFGNAMASGGTEERFDLRAFLAQYNDYHQYGFYAQTNNLNNTPRPGEKGNWTPNNLSEGQQLSQGVGATFHNYNKDKTVNNTFSVDFNYSRNHLEEDEYSRSYNEGGDLNGIYQGEKLGHQKKIKAENNFSYDIPNWSISSKLSLEYQKDDDATHSSTLNSRNGSNINFFSVKKNRQGNFFYLNMHNNALVKLPWGDQLSISLDGSYNKYGNDVDRHDSIFQYEKHNPLQIHQLGHTHNTRWNIGPHLSYLMYWSKKFIFSLGLDVDMEKVKKDDDNVLNVTEKQTYNLHENRKFLNGRFVFFYHDGSMKAGSWHNSLGFHLSKQWRDGDFTFNNSATHLHRQITTPEIQWIFDKFGGLWELDYSFTMSKMIPDLESLMMPKYRNSANSWTLGNQNLKNGMKDEVNLTWTKYFNRTRRVSINHRTNWNVSTDREVNHYIYDKNYTGYLSYAGNVNGNWCLYNHSGLNIALDSAKCWNLALGCDYNFLHIVGYRMTTLDLPSLENISTADLRTMLSGMADQLNMTNNVQTNYVGPDFSLSYQKGSFLASLKGTYHYNHSSGNTDFILSKNYHDFQYGATVHAQLPWKLNLATDMTMYSRRGYEMAWMNDNQLIWNVSLGREVIKNKLEVTLEGYDLFHQLKTRRVSSGATSYRENQFNTIPRYVLLRLQWRFNKK